MPLLARRAASATERTLVYFRMTMYMRPTLRLIYSPTHQSIAGRCWTRSYFRDGVKTGKAEYEHMFSAVHPRTDIDGFSRACDGQQNVRAYYATLPRPTVWRTSKPSNWGGSRYSGFVSPAPVFVAK